MLSMLYPKSGARPHRIVLPARWFGPTVSGDLVQAADLAFWLSGLPWIVEYDESLDAFVLTKVIAPDGRLQLQAVVR